MTFFSLIFATLSAFSIHVRVLLLTLPPLPLLLSMHIIQRLSETSAIYELETGSLETASPYPKSIHNSSASIAVMPSVSTTLSLYKAYGVAFPVSWFPINTNTFIPFFSRIDSLSLSSSWLFFSPLYVRSPVTTTASGESSSISETNSSITLSIM